MADEQKQKLVAGLESSPKYIPVSYKYDEIGSRLQKESCEHNHDYYITASELSILQHNVQDIIPDVPNDLTLVDLGSGDCSKTRFVIKELLKRQKTLMYYPLDISGEFLIKAAKSLKDDFGDLLEVHPIASDFIQGMEQLKRIKGVKLVLWIGGIFALPYEDQISKLKLFSTIMTDQCRLVFTAEITQNREDILKAYNDNTGLKRRSNLNGITRLKREEGSMIDLDKFSYHLDFVHNTNPEFMSYVLSYIEANDDVQFPIPGLGKDLEMKKEEHLYLHEGTGLSCKYTLEQLQTIVQKSGLRLAGTLIDKEKHVAFCSCVTG
ncbi:histidine N-alpha-methyltransferase-like isoform X2 [Argopecten irradians]